MDSNQVDAPAPGRAIRWWPGVFTALLMVLVRFGLPAVVPEAKLWAMLGTLVGSLILLIWWVFLSRAPWWERLAAILLVAGALAATRPLLDRSIATAGMGVMYFLYGIPSALLALALWAAAARNLSRRRARLATMAAAIVLACGFWALLRTDGVTGDGDAQLAWRWSPTHEDRLLAGAAAAPEPPPVTPASAPAKAIDEPAIPAPPAARAIDPGPPTNAAKEPVAVSWPGFRGPARDGVVRGLSIETDWAQKPPAELWRRAVGPGWSSFAASGDLIYTQEQRGDDELVSCYRLTTGEPVWVHRDATRFWESNAGAGPRSTPAVHGGLVYTLGATGILNALDARTGAVRWSRNAAADTEAKVPDWGFSGSPLVVADVVVVAAGGRLAAYDAATGAHKWTHRTGSGSYSSPHRVTVAGVEQVVLLNGAGVAGVALSDGKPLWKHAWEGFTSLQPAIAGEGALLISVSGATGGYGIRRLTVTGGAGDWSVAESWTSTGLKPYFNDFVIHEGHAYGFDGRILSCIDLNGGSRQWKGGRYGNGQLALLADQDLLLVLSEEGEVALVKATPDEFKEIARVKAIEGKTWNHPAVAGDVLLVRNGEEMAALRLSRVPR